MDLYYLNVDNAGIGYLTLLSFYLKGLILNPQVK